MGYLLDPAACANFEEISRREWLLTNGIGGYAMGTPTGINTRRYHGLLVAAIDPPSERMVLLGAIDASVKGKGQSFEISANQYPASVHPEGWRFLTKFYAGKHAEWTFEAGSLKIVRRLVLHQGENACTIEYENVGNAPFSLTLRPLICHKRHHENFRERDDYPNHILFSTRVTTIAHNGVALHLAHLEAQCMPVKEWYYRFEHQREVDRGLDPWDDLYCPLELTYDLAPGDRAVLVAATEPDVSPFPMPNRDTQAMDSVQALREAVSHFVVSTERRVSIIAGYPWFTDWGRDTMISLPGALLCTGRHVEARQILRDYASQLRDGLIPNRFVESGETPDYNTVDATLWFVNAVHKTLEAEWDESFAIEMAGVCHSIFDHHVGGTRFGIAVDPGDGLLTQGEEGVQLTWMDAKVGDWVVTPRQGKPVEVNALWINALTSMVLLRQQLGLGSNLEADALKLARSNFEQKFWDGGRGYYLDTAEPDDASLRPNQVIAMALPFTSVNPDHARSALRVVRNHLLTPRGLRTLDPGSTCYRARFEGNMRELDSAYHQGTVWPWLLGSYATAAARFGDDPQEPIRVLSEATAMLAELGYGGIAEVYDGDSPHRANGCPWQAWSAAEILRAWQEDVYAR